MATIGDQLLDQLGARRLILDQNDDQVDSTAQFLDWFKRPFLGQAFFELVRMQAEGRQNSPAPAVMWRAIRV